MEVVKAEPIHDFKEGEHIYQFKVELLEVEKVMIEVLNSQSGVKYRTYLNITDNWWKENSSKFQNDFSKVYPIINNCILKAKDYLNYEMKEKDDILFLKIIYMNDLFPFDVNIKIQRLISENGLTDEKINVLEYQLNMMRNMVSTKNKFNSRGHLIPDGEDTEIYNEFNNLVFKGTFRNNKRNGPGIEYLPESGDVVFKGHYKDGYRDGEGKTYNDQVNLQRKAEYKKGKFHGKVISYTVFPDDETNERRGSCIQYYKDGKQHGTVETYSYCHKAQDPQKKYHLQTKGNYENGVQEGLQSQFTIDSKNFQYRKELEYFMVKGKYHGEYISYTTGEVRASVQKYNMGLNVA